ncbi:MAG: metal-binding protein [Cyanobacteria bacterium SBLK]|nr:metal-binding protein [Cyanobacteria bacterium SBLK]
MGKPAKDSKSKQGNKPEKGRLVWNHSTHIPTLIPVLERLINLGNVTTVTPGVISRARGNMPQLKLRVSVPIRGGYKIIARHNKSVQEVFIITELSQKELEEAISECL